MAFLDETGLAELWSLVRTADVKIETGSYTGTGTYCEDNPNSLTFSFVPKVIIIDRAYSKSNSSSNKNTSRIGLSVFFAGRTKWLMDKYAVSAGSYSWADECSVTVTGTTVSWYCEALTGMYANTHSGAEQLNASGVVYNYIAIG